MAPQDFGLAWPETTTAPPASTCADLPPVTAVVLPGTYLVARREEQRRILAHKARC